MPVGPINCWLVFCSLLKSSTCIDGGRLVLGGRERNGSDLFDAIPRDAPRPPLTEAPVCKKKKKKYINIQCIFYRNE